MLRAVKLCQSSSMSGPSAQLKPISPKMAASSSITWPIGCSVPSVQVANSGRAGRLTSTFSLLSLAASAVALRALLRVSSAASISPLSWLTCAPNSRRWSGDMPPRVFISPVTLPFLPRAATRAASRAARSAACSTATSASLRMVERSLISRSPNPDTKKGSLRSRLPLCDPYPCAPLPFRGRSARTLLEGGLGLFHQGLKRRRLPHCQIGHDLAVDLDPGLQDAVHELRVGETVLARRGVDALDPQTAERALLVAPVAIGVLQALLDLLDADAERQLGAAAIALGELEDLLVTSVCGHAPLDACHGLPLVGEEVALDDARVGLRHQRHAGLLAQEAVAPLAHAVALADDAVLHLAGGREAKTLLGPALGLHLGHFRSFSKGYDRRPRQCPIRPGRRRRALIAAVPRSRKHGPIWHSRPSDERFSMKLAGKVALVTGAQQGIGAAIGRALAEAGADVALTWLDDKAGAEAVADYARQAGRRAHLLKADVAKLSDIEAMTAETTRTLGAPDILVNNAGVYPRVKFLEMRESDWDYVLDINLKAGCFATIAFAKALIAAGKPGGSVINLSSQAIRGAVRGVHYSASKGGVVSMTRAMALELAPYNIRVNAIAPGTTDTAQPRYGSSEEEIAAMGSAV